MAGLTWLTIEQRTPPYDDENITEASCARSRGSRVQTLIFLKIIQFSGIDMNWLDVLLNFLPDLFGAGVGAYLGYRYGIRQERETRKEEEKQLKIETINSLLQELDYNSEVLGNRTVMVISVSPENIVTLDVTPLAVSSYESAVSSGRYSLISPLNQIMLSEYYETCKRIMNKVHLTESTFQISTQRIKTHINEINKIGLPLIDFISEIEYELKKEL